MSWLKAGLCFSESGSTLKKMPELPCPLLSDNILSRTWCCGPWPNPTSHSGISLSPVSGHMFLLFLSVNSHLQQPLLLVYRTLSSSDTFLLMFACFLAPLIIHELAHFFLSFFNEGEMLPYAWKNKRRPKLTGPSAKHTWRQENGPCSTFCPALRRMPHCHQC